MMVFFKILNYFVLKLMNLPIILGVWQGVGRKEVGTILTEESLKTMFKASPIYHVQNVTTPTIIILGNKDQRVPNYQGKEFYYHLVSKNIPTKIFSYSDPHAITQVHFAYDAWMNITLFLNEFMNPKKD